ncbi:hemolysin family protein [Ruminiclostridium josui]|uniref:hemolysin family protein n=1 Tax=Ruminiclostridium josui TaxID=1499 RepID=UPI00046691DA|nr:hemolysin family protein [Ruminiclostridium josui]
MLTKVLLLVVLVLLNAFFSGSEIALISLNDKIIKKQAEDGDKKAKQLYNFLSEPSRFLATIQIGITLAGFLASAFATESFVDHLTGLLIKTGLPVAQSVIRSVSLIVITIILSYFTLVFGELIPKRLAMQKAEFLANIAVGPLMFLSRVTNPFVRFLTFSTNFFIKIFGGNPAGADNEKVTEEEIRMMMEVGEERGVIQDSEKEMIDNIFEFDNKHVSEIMTHRTNIDGIPVDSDLDYVLHVMNRDKYTRVPVYSENLDNIVGILHVKDLLEYTQNTVKDFNLKEIIRSAYFVPESKRTDELFKEMQKNKVHLAVVIDEYGGTAGIVTIEDLLEEIVGNIFDEYDVEQKDIEYLENDTYVFDGAISLDKVEEVLDEELPVDKFDTLGGFILKLLGRIPKADEKPNAQYENIVFRVTKMEGKRIVKVQASKKPND